MRSRSFTHLLIFSLFALILAGCAGSARVAVDGLARAHAPQDALPAIEFAPALVFGPGAAWLTGLDEPGTFAVGTWLAATPGPDWPEQDDKPVLAVGRVIERRARWARVEMLAVADPVRQIALMPHALPSAAAAPSLTKRLVPVLSEGGELTAPVGTADLVTGGAVYGVLPAEALARPDARRLAARIEGLARLNPLDPHTSQIVTLTGAAPRTGDHLVLLGVAPPRETTVEIVLGAGAAGAALQAELERLIAAQGLSGIRIEREALSETEAARRLTERHGDKLLVIVYGDADALTVASQLDRVRPGPLLPLAPIDATALSLPTLAAGVLGQVHALRGDHALALFTLEQALRGADDTVLAWQWLGATLVRDYVEVWRADWALEAVLVLEALAGEVGGGRATSLLEAALVASLSLPSGERRDALAEQLEQRQRAGATLDPLALEALARHANRERRWNEADRWLKTLSDRAAADSDEARFAARRLRLQLHLARGEQPDAEALEALRVQAHELGPLRELQVRVLAARAEVIDSGLISSALTELVDDIDSFGAPALGVELLTTAAARLVGDPQALTDQLVLQAAAFAQAARRPLAAVALLSELENLRLAQHEPSPVGGALGELYVSTLAAADRRLQLGRRALLAAQQAPDAQSARDALVVARALFHSIGDDINVAITELRLARLELDNNRPEVARDHLEAARRFEASARDAALTALREQLEQALTPSPSP